MICSWQLYLPWLYLLSLYSPSLYLPWLYSAYRGCTYCAEVIDEMNGRYIVRYTPSASGSLLLQLHVGKEPLGPVQTVWLGLGLANPGPNPNPDPDPYPNPNPNPNPNQVQTVYVARCGAAAGVGMLRLPRVPMHDPGSLHASVLRGPSRWGVTATAHGLAGPLGAASARHVAWPRRALATRA